jgi:hypothetical protein
MADDDDSFEIDALGNRVLIGLSAEETDEFVRLEALISESGPLLQIPWTNGIASKSADGLNSTRSMKPHGARF